MITQKDGWTAISLFLFKVCIHYRNQQNNRHRKGAKRTSLGIASNLVLKVQRNSGPNFSGITKNRSFDVNHVMQQHLKQIDTHTSFNFCTSLTKSGKCKFHTVLFTRCLNKLNKMLFNIRFTWLNLKTTALTPSISLFPDLI